MNYVNQVVNSSKSKSKANMKIVAIGLTAVAIVIVSLIASTLVLNPQNSELIPEDENEHIVSGNQNSWLFKGAYARYEGTTSLLLMTFTVEMRQEVINFNTTHAELLTSLNLISGFGDSEESNTTIWVNLEENQYEIEEATLTNKYETTETFEKFGTRDVIVYEYSTDGPTILVYVDKQINWPLKMSMELTGEDYINLNIDIELVETNIPELITT